MPGPILIVDDSQDTRAALTAVLHVKGYDTAVARSGDEALSYLRDGRPVSAIILDRAMPGLSGDEVHAELQRDPALASVPVIVFSALDDDGRLSGVLAYIRKGVDPDVLLKAIERACGQSDRMPPRSS